MTVLTRPPLTEHRPPHPAGAAPFRARHAACGFARYIARTTLDTAGYATPADAHADGACARLYALDRSKETTP